MLWLHGCPAMQCLTAYNGHGGQGDGQGTHERCRHGRTGEECPGKIRILASTTHPKAAKGTFVFKPVTIKHTWLHFEQSHPRKTE